MLNDNSRLDINPLHKALWQCAMLFGVIAYYAYKFVSYGITFVCILAARLVTLPALVSLVLLALGKFVMSLDFRYAYATRVTITFDDHKNAEDVMRLPFSKFICKDYYVE